MPQLTLFDRGTLGDLETENRLVVAPMTRVSGTPEGEVGPLMTDYYAAYGRGGFGSIITEGVYTDRAYSQGYRNQPGMVDRQQTQSWRHLIERVQEIGTKVIVQLMHAGALSQFNRFEASTAGPSAIAPKGRQMDIYYGAGDYQVPREMSPSDIETAIRGFADTAKRAQDAGADGVEVHGANGYLLDQFLTDYTNKRQDHYGGGASNRVKLTCEIIERVREAVGAGFTLGIRISQAKVNDYTHKWAGGTEDARSIFSPLAAAGATYIHTTEHSADKPAFETGPTLAALARDISGLPVIANGALEDPARALSLLQQGDADFIALGRGALGAPDWPERVRRKETFPAFDPGLLTPLPNLETGARFQPPAA